MTVLMEEKPAKKTTPTITKKEAKELRRINPQPAKEKQKIVKRRQKLIRQLGKQSQVHQYSGTSLFRYVQKVCLIESAANFRNGILCTEVSLAWRVADREVPL